MAIRPNARSSICLVVPYFGVLPPYIDCVFRSCAENPDIDWLILHDAPPPARRPLNVHFKQTTLADLRRSFSEKLGFEVNLTKPYLLCHFRPAFGFLLEAELAGYDFWGHCDLDMIFGNLRKFLREDILQEFPKILCRGHLCLYRNTSEVNRYFMLDAPGTVSYREAFQSGRTDQYTFDEWRGIYLILRYHGIPQFHDEYIADMAKPNGWRVTRFDCTGIKNYPEQVFYWHQGGVFHAHHTCDRGIVDDEHAYIHFQKRALPAPSFDAWTARGFLVTPDGFFPYNREPLTDADFLRYNHGRWRSRRELIQHIRQINLRKFIGKHLARLKKIVGG